MPREKKTASVTCDPCSMEKKKILAKLHCKTCDLKICESHIEATYIICNFVKQKQSFSPALLVCTLLKLIIYESWNQIHLHLEDPNG